MSNKNFKRTAVLDDKHTQGLIDAWFDGVLDAGGKAALEKALLESSAARAFFWQTAQIHALLREKGAGSAGAAAVKSDNRTGGRNAVRVVKVAAAAAAVALVATGAWVAQRMPPIASRQSLAASQSGAIAPVASSPAEITESRGSGNLHVAARVSDERAYLSMPEEAWAKRERQARIFAANTDRITKTFSKKAWVRSFVPLTSKEENKMKTISAAAVLSATAVIMGAVMAGAVSEPTLIDTSWGDRRWTTVYTNMVPLRWDWPEPAFNAELNIVGMGSGFTTNFNEITNGYDWQAFTGPRPNAEDVYDLTLTFRDASDNVVEALSASLTVVAGAFGPIAVNTSPDSRRWGLVKGNAVIPYCAGWAESTDGARDSRLIIEKSGGASQTNLIGSASGYYGWKLAGNGSVYGYGSYGLYLTFPGTEGEWDAFLTYVPKGFFMSIR